MRVLKFKSIIKRGMAMLLLASMLVGIIPGGGVKEARADSNDLRKTYLQLMSGTAAVNVDNIDQLSVNDLRCIALYLSNFYIPYATSLDDTDQQDKNEQYMVNALKSIGFKDDTARSLIKTVYQASLSSAKELYIREDQLYGGSVEIDLVKSMTQHRPVVKSNGDVALGLTGTGFSLSGDSFFGIIYKSSEEDKAVPFTDKIEVDDETVYYPLTMFAYNALPERYNNRFSASIQGFNVWNSGGGEDGGRVPIEFSWSDGGTMKPCFELNDFTCSFIREFADAVDLRDGSGGMSILSTSCEDFVTLKEKEQKALCTLTQRLYVDWVGNILCDFGDRRVIIYPACMNPYAFDMIGNENGVDSSENESDEEETLVETDRKSAFSLVSSWGVWFLGEGNVDTSSEVLEYQGEDSSEINLKMYTGSGISAGWSDKNNSPGAARVKEIISGWGYATGEFKDGGWLGLSDGGKVEPKLSLYSFDFSVDRSAVLSEVLVYKAITNNDMDNLDNGSAFVTGNIIEIGNGYFNQSNKFTVKSEDFSSYIQFTDADYQMLKNFFLTYAFAFNNRTSTSFDKDKNYINMKFCANNFPASLDTSIVWDNLDTDNEKITSFIYYLLHPWEGVTYVTTLIKNKLSGILVGFHEDIVGGTESNSTTGMTKYLGFTGYVTSPSLREIDWIDSLLTNYNNIVVYLIIAMCIIICCYLITGQMRPWRAIVGVFFFAFMALIPPVALNFAADKVNLFCDTVYSGKFDYWAYTQMETYLAKLGDTQSASSTTDYITKLMSLQTNTERGSKIGFSGVKVKWMTPKKTHTDAKAVDETSNALSESFSSLFISVISTNITSMNVKEEYVDSVNATYLYRDLVDIYLYAACGYNLYTTFSGDIGYDLYAVGEGNTKDWDYTADNVLGELTYSSGEEISDYVRSAYDASSVDGGDVQQLTSSPMAVGYGFLHDNYVDRDSSANYDPKSATYTPSEESYIQQDGGLALGLPFAMPETFAEIHSNYMLLLEDLEYWSEGDNLNIELSNIDNHIYGLPPKTFDLSLMDIQKNASSRGVSSNNSDDNNTPSGDGSTHEINRTNLSGFYYALYAESPFYFFSNHFRDYVVAHHPQYAFSYPIQNRNTDVYRLFLDNNQEYFFNYASTAGDGYGELRDFMGMHDLFYYIIPLLAEGNKIADTFDKNFGMYVNEDTPLQISREGKIIYGGKTFETFDSLISALEENSAGIRAIRNDDGVRDKNNFEELTPEQKYKLWHDYNVWTIFQSYVPWVDTMEDCGYAKSEIIRIAGEKYVVENPLDPTSYYASSDGVHIDEGRLMVFSRSEMKFYGLTENDLTQVEKKIIQVQDNVYKNALDLMNYYTLSDEVIINAFSMLQVFEFNKAFSQDTIFGSSYIMYPQGYEAKAFTYDAYLRLVVAEASGEPLQVNQNGSEDTSIYRRVLKNTSIFFGITLLVNDILAVYVIPVMKVAILLMLFFTSIFLIVGAAIKIELNPLQTIWQSLLAPLGSYVLICTGFAWVVSLFMSNGAEGVVKTSKTIAIGDPTTVLLIMIFIHVMVVVLLFKICRKCFKDLKTSVLSVLDNITATAIGAAMMIGSTLTGARRLRSWKSENGYPGGVPSTAAQRGKQNTAGFSNMFGGAAGAAMAGQAMGANMPEMAADAKKAAQRADDRYGARKNLNKYDAKAYDKATDKEDRLRDKYEALSKKSSQAAYRGNGKAVAKYETKLDKLQQQRENAAKYARDISNGDRRYAYNNKAKDTFKGVSGRVSGMARSAAMTMHDISGNVGYAAGRARVGADNFSTAMKNAPGEIRSAAGDVYRAVGKAPSIAKGAALRGLSAAESYEKRFVGTVVQTKRTALNTVAQVKRNFDAGYGIGRGTI